MAYFSGFGSPKKEPEEETAESALANHEGKDQIRLIKEQGDIETMLEDKQQAVQTANHSSACTRRSGASVGFGSGFRTTYETTWIIAYKRTFLVAHIRKQWVNWEFGCERQPVVSNAGLRSMLEEYPDIHVIGEARNGVEAIFLVEKFHPSVVIIDINMPR